jgi:hypothetical protein
MGARCTRSRARLFRGRAGANPSPTTPCACIICSSRRSWVVYPRRVSREHARKTFAAAVKCGVEPAALFATSALQDRRLYFLGGLDNTLRVKNPFSAASERIANALRSPPPGPQVRSSRNAPTMPTVIPMGSGASIRPRFAANFKAGGSAILGLPKAELW